MMRSRLAMAVIVLLFQATVGQAVEPLDETLTLPGIHPNLTGQEYCIRCHDETQRASDSKCLECHAEIQTKLDQSRGYHYNAVVGEDQTCGACHKEHRGENEKLSVWLNKEQMKAFDHDLTGYRLEGAHREVDCRRCHESGNVHSAVTQRSHPQDSFLGLTRDCASCHEDLHQSRFGVDCQQCHTMGKWPDLVGDAPFDHGKTDYALAGGHANVDCLKCHRSGRQMDPVSFATCHDCHDDAHQAQLTDRADGGRCDACHDVGGFVPSLYDLDDHADSRYPISGAHQAVACSACHTKTRTGSVDAVRLNFDSFRCESCHTDDVAPGHVTEISERISCEDCHVVNDWGELAFDHSGTKFPLTGRHRDVSCLLCHVPESVGTPIEQIRYIDLATDCASCHEDIHQAQFAEKSCDACHSSENWKPDSFDHRANSSYALEGKHQTAECTACHRVEVASGGELFRRFKPIDADCTSCHGPDGSVLDLFGTVTARTGAMRP